MDAGALAKPPLELLNSAVRTTLADHGVKDAEISLALLNDQDIKLLNRDHLGRDRTTDVIAFALWTEGETVVGDVYVGFEQAARQAAEAQVDLHEELARLAIHGTLHVLGLDHPEGADDRVASEMFVKQESLVQRVMAER